MILLDKTILMKYRVDILRAERKRRKWSLTELGFRCGVSAGMISYVESGGRTSEGTIKKMARILRVPLKDIRESDNERVA